MNHVLNPEIGVKVLIPEANPVGDHRYLALKRSGGKDRREWDLPGGRANLNFDTYSRDTVGRELLEEIGLMTVGEVVPIAAQRITRQAASDVVRFTVLASPIDSLSFSPVLSEEHRRYDWLTRCSAAGLQSDRYLPWVLSDEGPLDQLERSGVILSGPEAIAAAVRELKLLGT